MQIHPIGAGYRSYAMPFTGAWEQCQDPGTICSCLNKEIGFLQVEANSIVITGPISQALVCLFVAAAVYFWDQGLYLPKGIYWLM